MFQREFQEKECFQASVRLQGSCITLKNISTCATMSKNGKLIYFQQEYAFNIQDFMNFVNNVLSKFNEINIFNAVIVLDNVAFHRNMSVRERIEEAGHRILFLPPYSLFLNPIENMFAQ